MSNIIECRLVAELWLWLRLDLVSR